MTRILQISIAIFVLLYSAAAQAKEPVCGGTDLVAKFEKTQPLKAQAMQEKADALPFSRGVLWKVELEGVAPSYIFGTMHVADPRLIDLPAEADAAFEASDTLALEIAEIVDPQKMAQQSASLLQYTGYLDGTSLDDRMNEEEIAVVKSLAASKTGLPWNVARKIKPGILMGMLSLPACELARKRAGEPFLDLALGQRAVAEGKTLVGLETLESQLKVFDALPEDLLIRSLVQAAQFGPMMDDVFETMIVQYERGALGTIWAMFQSLGPKGLGADVPAEDYAEFQRIVVDERNIKMADESEKLIKQGRAFIAVGALHLPGEKGLVNILAQRGYKISKP